METINEWLHSNTARDVMTATVVCLNPRDRLADAVNLFLREQISGAPVVDEHGACVGVLSATDVLHFEVKRAEAPAAIAVRRPHYFDKWDPGGSWWHEAGRVRADIQPRLAESVVEFMTRDVVGVSDDTPLGDVIRDMVDAHVHRVVVLDSARRPKGIVTTTDVLAAILRASQPRQSVTADACRAP